MNTFFEPTWAGFYKLSVVLLMLAVAVNLVRKTWPMIVGFDWSSQVRWAYCLRQSALGFFVALFAVPTLGIMLAVVVGCATPFTVALMFRQFENLTQRREYNLAHSGVRRR